MLTQARPTYNIVFFLSLLFIHRFEPYFERKKKLMPKPSDLSFFNWETQTSTSNATPNFQVIADNEVRFIKESPYTPTNTILLLLLLYYYYTTTTTTTILLQL